MHTCNDYAGIYRVNPIEGGRKDDFKVELRLNDN